MVSNAIFNPKQFSKQKSKRRKKLILVVLGTLFFLGAALLIVAYSNLFKIRNFFISGNEHLAPENVISILEPQIIQNPVEKFLGKYNLWSWNISRPDLKNTAILSAQVKRKWLSQSLQITIEERNRFAVWCPADNSCYWIDKNGIAFEEAPATEGSLLLLVRDYELDKVEKGTAVLEERFLGNAIKVLEEIKDLNLSIKEIVLVRKLEEMQAKTYGGPDLLFSIRFDPTFNFGALRSLGEKDGLKRMQYIDLRVENRLYYKNL